MSALEAQFPESSVTVSVFDRLTAITPDYMKLPIQDGFNWTDALADIDAGEWYLVVFRSRHRDGIDHDLLNDHDEHAQVAARNAEGFRHYFMGTPADDGECMSFCLWDSQQHAQLAAQHSTHQEAQSLAYSMYDWFRLERWVVRKIGAEQASGVSFEAVQGGSRPH